MVGAVLVGTELNASGTTAPLAGFVCLAGRTRAWVLKARSRRRVGLRIAMFARFDVFEHFWSVGWSRAEAGGRKERRRAKEVINRRQCHNFTLW